MKTRELSTSAGSKRLPPAAPAAQQLPPPAGGAQLGWGLPCPPVTGMRGGWGEHGAGRRRSWGRVKSGFFFLSTNGLSFLCLLS